MRWLIAYSIYSYVERTIVQAIIRKGKRKNAKVANPKGVTSKR